MRRRFGAVMIVIGALALGGLGCATTDSATKDSASDRTTGTGTNSEFDDGSMGSSSSVSGAAIGDLEAVYFDFDQSSIRSDAAGTLRGNAEAIKRNGSWGQITIQGNTDERGSEEYNLALGERRATAVQRYLIDLGVPSSRLRTVSFGEATPAVPGHDESAYRYNRRAEFAN
jgi:peptidoglycan-associated lipoprotein